MIKKTMGMIFTSAILAGCVSALPHLRFSDTEIKSNGENMAFAATCAEQGLISGEAVYAYGYAVTEMLSVSVYNKDLYEKSYKNRKDLLTKHSPESYKDECYKFAEFLPTGTRNVINRYSDIVQSRQSSLVGMGQTAASFGNNMPVYNQQNIQIPSGQVNFNSTANLTNHYLVDFGQGQRLCIATSSGYVRCQ